MGKPFHVRLRFDAGDFRRWQLHVVSQLSADPSIVLELEWTQAAMPYPAGLELLFAFDRIFVGRAAEMATDLVRGPDGQGSLDRQRSADLVLDLTGNDAPAETGETLVVLKCSGVRPLIGALAAIIDDGVPRLTADLLRDERRQTIADWAVAIEDRNNSLRGTSMVLGRMAHLALSVVFGYRDAEDRDRFSLFRVAGQATFVSVKAGQFAAAALLTRSIAHRIRSRLDRLSRSRTDWRVMTRLRVAGTVPYAPLADQTPFQLLPDDGGRFYADPFPITIDGRTWLFVEEFPYASGRGIISVAEIGSDGHVGAMRPVLEQGCHLSYPNVFEADGRSWMIPETAERKTIELWVADDFPCGWTLHNILVDKCEAADATLAKIDGTWWMFAATRSLWGSSWDALSLWRAPHFSGPWSAVGNAPAVVDVGSARPAGRMFELPDGWRRPVQDSRVRYGGGMALTKIDAIGPDCFAEHLEMRFPVRAPLAGLHTWNSSLMADRYFEAMDVFADPFACGPLVSLT